MLGVGCGKFHCDHFTVYIYIKSTRCRPQIYTILYVYICCQLYLRKLQEKKDELEEKKDLVCVDPPLY